MGVTSGPAPEAFNRYPPAAKRSLRRADFRKPVTPGCDLNL